MLDGFARVKGRCTAIGRNSMSADLQEAVHSMRSIAPSSPDITAVLDAALRLNDAYIKVTYQHVHIQVHMKTCACASGCASASAHVDWIRLFWIGFD